VNFAALLKSELRKIVYARSTWWLLVGGVLFASLSTAVMPLILDTNAETVNGVVVSRLLNADIVDAMFGKAAAGYYFSMILGAMILAGEFGKGTAIATFLAAPRRQSVLWAKVVIAALVGLGVQIISAIVAATVGLIVLNGYPHAQPHLSAFGDLALTASISGIVMGLVGLAVGALVRNQTGAIVGLMAWMFLIDPILTAVLGIFKNDAGKFLFSALIGGIMDLHIGSIGGPRMQAAVSYFAPLTCIALLLGYAAVLVAAALFTSLRRDID
jgi:ABC-type transport system involved in multi-copper enzyme maturation permease subunit